jgi:hypothetical protein
MTLEELRKQRILYYLREAQIIFDEWSQQESSVEGDVNDREPIIAIAAMLQVEDSK